MHTLDQNIVTTLVSKAQRLSLSQVVPYEWEEVERLIRADPNYFKLSLQKAERYDDDRQAHTLWIALNLVSAKMKVPWCYYCGKKLEDEDFLTGKVHLEHFNPRSLGGGHAPANIVHSCNKCDGLKSAMSVEQRRGLWDGTLSVQTLFPKLSRVAQRRLLEFVDLDAPHLVGLGEYAKRHRVALSNVRRFWDGRKEDFRKRWNW